MLPVSFLVELAHAHYDQAADSASNITFEKRSEDASQTIFQSASAPLGLPHIITWKPVLAKPGATGVDRRNLKIQRYALDSNGVVHNMTHSLLSTVPRTDAFTEADIQNDLAILFSLFHPEYLSGAFPPPVDAHNAAFFNAFLKCSQ